MCEKLLGCSKRTLKRWINKKVSEFDQSVENFQDQSGEQDIIQIYCENDSVDNNAEKTLKNSTIHQDEKEDFDIKKELRNWIVQFRISRNASDKLLNIANRAGLEVPLKTCTLFNTSDHEKICIKNIHPGTYFHYGLEKAISSIKNNVLENEIKELKKEMVEIKRVLAYQNILLEKVVKVVVPANYNLKIFPIKELNQLEQLDKHLENTDHNELITYVRSITGRGKITKCLPLFFTEDLMKQINWDGRQRKFAVKTLRFFTKIVYEACKTDEIGYPDYEKQFKLGIRQYKNRIYKDKK